MNQSKTVLLMAVMTAMLLVLGKAIGGTAGLQLMFLFSCVMNFITYWYSDKIVLKSYNAIEISERDNPDLYQVVARLARRGNIPMPRVYIIQSDVPNAFATGRNPSNAAVAVTTGIMNLLNDDEIEGVLGHELTHVMHRDILISTIAATLAGLIVTVSNMGRFMTIFGSNSNSDNRESGFQSLFLLFLAPIAASLIQMGISRSREYLADEGGARLSGKPLALASALNKIDYYAKHGMLPHATENTAHMFIINPLAGGQIEFSSLFSTHPSTASRIEKLKEMAAHMR